MNEFEQRNERIATLICFFLSKNPGAGRTQIVKFLYLTDLEYRQYQGKPVTDLEYVWGDFGPFDQRIYNVLETMKRRGLVQEAEYVSGHGKPAYRYELTEPCRRDGLHRAEVEVAEHIAAQVRDTPLRELLDDVVYETEPMLDAKQREARGQKLNMDVVNLKKRRFGIDLEKAWDNDEAITTSKSISAEKLFTELLGQCPP